MKRILITGLCVLLSSICGAQDSSAVDYGQREKEILSILNQGLKEWYEGNPEGYVVPFASQITYFDPGTEGKRILSKDQLKALVTVRDTKADYSDLVDPVFQHTENSTVLTFNFSQDFNGIKLHWNATEVYRKTANGWEIVHAHWSPYSSELSTLPTNMLIGAGAIGVILFLAVGFFIGKRWGMRQQHG